MFQSPSILHTFTSKWHTCTSNSTQSRLNSTVGRQTQWLSHHPVSHGSQLGVIWTSVLPHPWCVFSYIASLILTFCSPPSPCELLLIWSPNSDITSTLISFLYLSQSWAGFLLSDSIEVHLWCPVVCILLSSLVRLYLSLKSVKC